MRTWASVMWIIISPLAGFMNEKYGMKYSIGIYAIGSLLAVPAGWLLPLESLRPKEPTIIIAPREELEEPLLMAEEAAPAAPLPQREVEEQRPNLARALAIVRFIEAITELGAIPPPGSLYGFAEVATPYAAGHFRDSEFDWENREKEGDEGDEERGERGEGREERETEDDVPVSTPPSITEPLLIMPGGGQLRIQVPPPPPPESLPSAAPVALPRGGFSHDLSAGDLLRDIRDIQPPQQRSSESGEGSTEQEEEVHAWMPASPDMEQPKEESDLKTAESPGRSSALKRLAQIFTWRSAAGGAAAATATVEEEEEASLPPTPVSYLSGADSPSAAAAHDLLSGFTPVQNYLESRRRRLTATAGTAAASNTAAAAAANSRTGGRFPCLYLTEEPSLAHVLEGNYDEINPTPSIVTSIEAGSEAAQPQPQTSTAAAVFRAGISPELMREALDMEAADIAGMDPTGSLVVDVLSKKLARMAAREKRRQARKQRQWRQHQKEKQQKHIKFAETTNHHPSVDIAAHTAADDSSPLLLPSGTATTTAAAPASHSIWSRLVILFHDPSILSFFTIATLLGFGHGIIGTFLFMYLKHLGAGEGLMGWVLLANALPELPVFYFFGTILRVVGMDTLLLGSTAVLSLRIAAYSLFNTSTMDCTVDLNCTGASRDISIIGDSLHSLGIQPLSVRWIYAIETLHAITYAVGWSACALNASKIAPPGLESTTQAVFQGLWSGIGAGTGGLVGGFLYHWKGPDALFLCSAAAIAVGCGVSGIVLGLQHKKRRYQRQHGSTLNLLDL